MREGFPSDALLAGLLETRLSIVREPIGGPARHHLQRVRAGDQSWVLKAYRRDRDEHFAHRYRREERMLTLLADAVPGLSPALTAGVVGPEAACLLMEDLGPEALSLHRTLERAPGGPAPVAGAAAALSRWHAFTESRHDLLAAFCQSIVLDRNDRATLARRHRVALRRIGVELSESDARGFADAVVDPLLERPHRVIHNSANALNFVVRGDGSVALIDFETIALGPLEFDLAELAIHPRIFARHGLAGTAAMYPGDLEPKALARAGLLRAIDACGALARQARRATGPDAGLALRKRADGYRGVAVRIAAELGIERHGLAAA